MSALSTLRRAMATAAVLGVCVGPAAAQGPDGAETGPEVALYGYVKLDASWDQRVVDAGNFARWVLSPDAEEPHAHFNMTARQSRIGLRIGSSTGSVELAGRWEADFYGGGGENKNSMQVRHAYVEIAWPSGLRVIAGQTSDVVSPLAPSTLNYTVAWWAGNIGYRRPQLRVEHHARLGGAEVTLTGAASRTIGDDFGRPEPGDAGADSGVPALQGRLGIAGAIGNGRAALGAYGHRGRENLSHEMEGGPTTLSATGWGADASLVLAHLRIAGEAWHGSNLDDYLGGIATGVRLTEADVGTVSGSGGWLELTGSGGHVDVSVGAGVDDPDDADLAAGDRSRNVALWASARRDFGGGLLAGLEVSRWATRYLGLAEGTSLRIQASVVYSF